MQPDAPTIPDHDALLREHLVAAFRQIAIMPTPDTAGLALTALRTMLDARIWERPRQDASGVTYPPVDFLPFVRSLAPAGAIDAGGIRDPDLAAVEWLGLTTRGLAKLMASGGTPAIGEAVTNAVVPPLLRQIAAEARADAPWLDGFYAAVARAPADALHTTARH